MKTTKRKKSLFETNLPKDIVDVRRINGGQGPETQVTGDTDSTLGGTDCGDFIRGSSFPYDSDPTQVGHDG